MGTSVAATLTCTCVGKPASSPPSMPSTQFYVTRHIGNKRGVQGKVFGSEAEATASFESYVNESKAAAMWDAQLTELRYYGSRGARLGSGLGQDLFLTYANPSPTPSFCTLTRYAARPNEGVGAPKEKNGGSRARQPPGPMVTSVWKARIASLKTSLGFTPPLLAFVWPRVLPLQLITTSVIPPTAGAMLRETTRQPPVSEPNWSLPGTL